MTTALEAMANGADLSKFLPGDGDSNVDVTPNAPAAVPDKPTVTTPTPIQPGVFNQAELDIMNPKPNGPGTTQKKEEKPEAIAGTPYVSVEAMAEGYKNLQRRNSKLEAQIEKELPGQIQAGVKAELAKMLAEQPKAEPQESDEEKALKSDDPESYRVLQLEKREIKRNEEMQSLLDEIRSIKQAEQVRGIQSEFQKVSEAKNVPLKALMAYGSLAQYANTSAEDLADIVKEELGITDVKPTPTPTPAPVDNTAGLRSPETGGASAVVNETIDLEKIGPLGSRGWKELEKKMVQVALNRLKGGAGQ